MSDDLRDRIAKVIRDHGTPVGLDTGEEDEFDCCAQAIIDDLGLVVERTVRVVDCGAGEVRIPETRVVGKWERS